MGWKLLAHTVLLLHAAWVLFNVLAPLWCWKRPRWRTAHLCTLVLTLLFFIASRACPLTDLEDFLLRKADPAAGGYPGGFTAGWLARLVYWDVPPGTIGAATAAWFALWLGVYAWLWRKGR